MIDPNHEELVPVAKAGRMVNPSRPPHAATVWRWCLSGLRGGVKLESLKVGGIRFTSREAVGRFIRACNTPGSVPEPPSRAAERAGERLKARGC